MHNIKMTRNYSNKNKHIIILFDLSIVNQNIKKYNTSNTPKLVDHEHKRRIDKAHGTMLFYPRILLIISRKK